MRRVTTMGDIPKFLGVFLKHKLFTETEDTQVWDMSYNELINKAQDDKLEVQVLIDRKNDKAYLCGVGASYEKNEITGAVKTPPVFYFAELDEAKKKEFIRDLQEARERVKDTRKMSAEDADVVKKNTREMDVDPEDISSRL